MTTKATRINRDVLRIDNKRTGETICFLSGSSADVRRVFAADGVTMLGHASTIADAVDIATTK